MPRHPSLPLDIYLLHVHLLFSPALLPDTTGPPNGSIRREEEQRGMKYTAYLQQLAKAGRKGDGRALAGLLAGEGGKGLVDELEGMQADQYNLAGPSSSVSDPWGSIGLSHALAVLAAARHQYADAYAHQNALLSALLRWAQSSGVGAWVLEAVGVCLRDLRAWADMASEAMDENKGALILEDCARTINKAFTVCATDRTNTGPDSRRQGLYKMAALSIKSYFRANKPTLCKNIIRAVSSDTSYPPLETFPLADQVTWRFYIGMLAFQAGDEATAERELSWAFARCHRGAKRNQELILNYLIPLRLLSGRFPSPALLARFPALEALYAPFLAAIRDGNLRAYDEALEWAQQRLVSMNCWMTVERAREVCLRGLFRIVWLASDKSSRIPIAAFKRAMALQGADCDVEEVECMVANMIYKGYIKGYISHGMQMVVLAKTGAFPVLTSRRKAAP